MPALFFFSEGETLRFRVFEPRANSAGEEGFVDAIVDQSGIEVAAHSFGMFLSLWLISKEKLIEIHQRAGCILGSPR